MTDSLIPEFFPGRQITLRIPATVETFYGDSSVQVRLATHETSLCFTAKQLRRMQQEET